jgi:hypothetical protein
MNLEQIIKSYESTTLVIDKDKTTKVNFFTKYHMFSVHFYYLTLQLSESCDWVPGKKSPVKMIMFN